MIRSHKIALALNNRQHTYFQKAAGTARFSYNWALCEWDRQYQEHKANPMLPAPSEGALRRQLNSIKREQFPWMLEVTKNAPQTAIMQLGQAFRNFFNGSAKHPRFHKKGLHDSFTITNDQFDVKGKRIRIPNLGWVRMCESLRFEGKIMSATISRTADKWFVSITVETGSIPAEAKNHGSVGVDLGISALATLSTGEKLEGPKAHKALLHRQRRLSRLLSRKMEAAKAEAGLRPRQAIPKGVRIPLSQNALKTKTKLGKLHARIANIRNDAMHKLTTGLSRRFDLIGIEDLNVSGMMKNSRLARSIADMSFFEFRRQLDYKAAMYGGIVVVADQWHPSSKTCSFCGHKLDKLPLSCRTWSCPECGSVHDRDINAAINLEAYAKMVVGDLAGSSPVTACGEKGSDSGRKTGTKPVSMKQEFNCTAIGMYV
ncbi:MAG: transposase [Syntrophobacterales bacterium]|nr:transposase [Syntrophobacterales bacterium]